MDDIRDYRTHVINQMTFAELTHLDSGRWKVGVCRRRVTYLEVPRGSGKHV